MRLVEILKILNRTYNILSHRTLIQICSTCSKKLPSPYIYNAIGACSRWPNKPNKLTYCLEQILLIRTKWMELLGMWLINGLCCVYFGTIIFSLIFVTKLAGQCKPIAEFRLRHLIAVVLVLVVWRQPGCFLFVRAMLITKKMHFPIVVIVCMVVRCSKSTLFHVQVNWILCYDVKCFKLIPCIQYDNSQRPSAWQVQKNK